MCFLMVCCKSRSLKPGEPTVHSLQETSGCWRGPQAIPGKSLPCPSPAAKSRACAGIRGLCKVQLLSLPCPLKPRGHRAQPGPAPMGSCWISSGGNSQQPQSVLGKSSGTPSFRWNKPEAGLAGGLIMFAQPVPQNLPDKRRHQVVQKVPNKAPDEHRHDQTSSSVADLGRWREGRRHKEQETHRCCWFLCWQAAELCTGENSDFSVLLL